MDDIKRIRKPGNLLERKEKDSAFEALYNRKEVGVVNGVGSKGIVAQKKWVWLIVVAALLIGGGIVISIEKGWVRDDKGGRTDKSDKSYRSDRTNVVNLDAEVGAGKIDPEALYAVYLADGNVYYGRLSKIDSDFPELRDVFYPLGGDTSDKTYKSYKMDRSDMVRLVKREAGSGEAEGAMIVNKRNLISYEKLSPESPIVRTIREYLNRTE